MKNYADVWTDRSGFAHSRPADNLRRTRCGKKAGKPNDVPGTRACPDCIEEHLRELAHQDVFAPAVSP